MRRLIFLCFIIIIIIITRRINNFERIRIFRIFYRYNMEYFNSFRIRITIIGINQILWNERRFEFNNMIEIDQKAKSLSL